MNPAKIAILVFLETKIFWNKVYNVIISDHNIINFVTWAKLYPRCGYVTKVWQLKHFNERSYHSLSFIRIWPEEILFLRSGLDSKFNNSGLVLGMALKFYASVVKKLKLKVRKFLELVPTFVEITEEKLVGILPPSPYPHHE